MVSITQALIPKNFRLFAGTLLFGVTPAIPVSLKRLLPKRWPRNAFFSGVILGWFFCFIVIFVWTHVAGTYEGTDPSRVYFKHDWENIINYTLLVPLYIGFAAVLIVLACQSWLNLVPTRGRRRTKKARWPNLPLTVVFFVIVALSLGL